jgi:hypothetical protein
MARWGDFLVASLVGTALTGCVQNAALELELTLPPGPTAGAPVYALIQPRRSTDPFEDEWRASDDPEALELAPGEPTLDHISVLSQDDTIDLHLKVRFCSTPTCSVIEDDGAPESRFSLEHPFYIGKRTFWSASIDAIPTMTGAVTEVDKCVIRGCIEGILGSYCRDGTDRHVCED